MKTSCSGKFESMWFANLIGTWYFVASVAGSGMRKNTCTWLFKPKSPGLAPYVLPSLWYATAIIDAVSFVLASRGFSFNEKDDVPFSSAVNEFPEPSSAPQGLSAALKFGGNVNLEHHAV